MTKCSENVPTFNNVSLVLRTTLLYSIILLLLRCMFCVCVVFKPSTCYGKGQKMNTCTSQTQTQTQAAVGPELAFAFSDCVRVPAECLRAYYTTARTWYTVLFMLRVSWVSVFAYMRTENVHFWAHAARTHARQHMSKSNTCLRWLCRADAFFSN